MASHLEVNNSDSDISFLSDVDDHFKPSVPNELQFVDSYFQQETTSEEEASFQNDLSKEEDAAAWDRLSDWLHCVCVVTFDLEIGQMIEVCQVFW